MVSTKQTLQIPTEREHLTLGDLNITVKGKNIRAYEFFGTGNPVVAQKPKSRKSNKRSQRKIVNISAFKTEASFLVDKYFSNGNFGFNQPPMTQYRGSTN